MPSQDDILKEMLVHGRINPLNLNWLTLGSIAWEPQFLTRDQKERRRLPDLLLGFSTLMLGLRVW